jgi:hypothetical protein
LGEKYIDASAPLNCTEDPGTIIALKPGRVAVTWPEQTGRRREGVGWSGAREPPWISIGLRRLRKGWLRIVEEAGVTAVILRTPAGTVAFPDAFASIVQQASRVCTTGEYAF